MHCRLRHKDASYHDAWVPKPILRRKKYVTKWINNEVMTILQFFTLAAAILAAILNISNSPSIPEWHEPDSQIVGHIVSYSAKKNFGRTAMHGSPPLLQDYTSVDCDSQNYRWNSTR